MKQLQQIHQIDAMHLVLDASNGEESPYRFSSLRQLVDSGMLQNGSRENPVTLYVMPGVYWIHDPDREEEIIRGPERGLPYEMTISFGWLRIIGVADDPAKVVFAANKGQSFGCIGNYTMFHLLGEGLYLQGLTIGNYCSVDLEYPWNPALSRKRRTNTITQAQLGDFNGEEMLAENCRFVSRLNLYPISGGRKTLYSHCHFESTDDSLNGHAVYLHCDFDLYGGSPLGGTSPSGSVFLGCRFQLHCRQLRMIKNRGQIVLVNCQFHSDSGSEPQGGDRNPGVLAYEYGNLWDGVPFSLQQVNIQAVPLQGRSLLQAFYDPEKGHYPFDRLLGKMHLYRYSALDGIDSTEPVNLTAVLLRVETELPAGRSFKYEDQLFLRAQTYTFDMVPCGEMISFVPSSEILSYVQCAKTSKDGEWMLENRNTGEKPLEGMIQCSTESGLQAQASLTLLPAPQQPPRLLEGTTIGYQDGALTLCYTLEGDQTLDDSRIVWYRQQPQGESLPVSDGLHGQGVCYNLDEDDIGCILWAKIYPKSVSSEYGAEETAAGFGPISSEMVRRRWYKHTDFTTLPLENRSGKGVFCTDFYTPVPQQRNAEWHKHTGEQPEAPWKYGKLGYGAQGFGIYPATQGTSISYTPAFVLPSLRRMEVSVRLDPVKLEGQGFGSAGQYLDVGIAFDRTKRNGPALQIQRTKSASDGVEMSLVLYEDGQVRGLTQPVMASCFLTGCQIRLGATAQGIWASVDCTAPQRQGQREKGWQHQVSLQAELPVDFAHRDFCLVHTGTCGDQGWLNVVLLHEITVVYGE